MFEPCYVLGAFKETHKLQAGRFKMSRQSQARESFSRMVVAVIGAAAIIGAAAWAFSSFDSNKGCSPTATVCNGMTVYHNTQ